MQSEAPLHVPPTGEKQLDAVPLASHTRPTQQSVSAPQLPCATEQAQSPALQIVVAQPSAFRQGPPTGATQFPATHESPRQHPPPSQPSPASVQTTPPVPVPPLPPEVTAPVLPPLEAPPVLPAPPEQATTPRSQPPARIALPMRCTCAKPTASVSSSPSRSTASRR